MTPKEHIKRLCLIPLCKNERFDLVHKFPMDNQRAEEWRRAINIPEINSLSLDLLRKRTICSKHFRKEDYKNIESRSLNKTAVPSLNFTQTQNATEKISSHETLKRQSSMVGVTNNSDRREVCLIQKTVEQLDAVVESNSSAATPRKNLLYKVVCNANNATTLFSDTAAPSPKRRVVVSNRASNINIRFDEAQLSLIPSTKVPDGKYVNVTLLPVVNVHEDPVTIIDPSPQLDFFNQNNELNYIQEADLFESDEIADPYASEVIDSLDSSYLSK